MRPITPWLLLIAGCTGVVGGPAGGDDPPPPPGDDPPPFAPAPAAMYRLTQAQYLATVDDLFESRLTLPTDLEVDSSIHGFTSVGASELTVSPRAVEQYETAALELATQIVSTPLGRAGFFGCDPATVSDPCIDAWLRDFGRRAYRRSLTDGEVDGLRALAVELEATLGDRYEALGFVIARILQSPSFLFRIERGEPDPDRPGQRRYTSVEMASRLSYLLWGTMPDDELLAAGERGDLVTDEGITTQAQRLMADPRAREALTDFFGELMQLDRIQSATKDPAIYPQMTDALRASMRRELELLFADIAFGGGDLRELVSTDVTFVDDELAALYGIEPPGGTGPVRATLPPGRGGLMGRAGLLTALSHNTTTSPTLRGKFIRANLLCEDIPPPPPGIDTTLPRSGTGPQTLRQRLEVHRQNAACASCHDKMDPLGFALEELDPIGRFRDNDEGLPIDAATDVDGTPVDGAEELGFVLAADPRVGACFARRLYRHANGHLELESEERAIRALEEGFTDAGFRLPALVELLVRSDGFRSAGESR